MKSFDRWLDDFFAEVHQSEAPEDGLLPDDMLPEGVYVIDDRYMVDCCCCGRPDDIPVDISELPMTGYDHYCGKDPYCCP